MKIILSRKGFDSGFGGIPSPILPNGEMLSLPIPDIHSSIKFSDLVVSQDQNYEQIISELGNHELKLKGIGKQAIMKIGCHLDPDIRQNSLHRDSKWKGLFGQSGAAQSHFRNQNVTVGDIFLFFGWFANTFKKNGKLRFENKKGFHAIYGYLEIAEIIDLHSHDIPTWMQYHPHYRSRNIRIPNDTLYVATDRLSLNNDLNGYGTFKFKTNLKLTKEGFSRSRWNLPEFFRNTTISYHSDKSWKSEYFQSAAKGQEFVIEATDEIQEWTRNIIVDSQSSWE